jgi:hypothetical protein
MLCNQFALRANWVKVKNWMDLAEVNFSWQAQFIFSCPL